MEPLRVINNPFIFDICGFSLCIIIIMRIIKLEKIKRKRGEKTMNKIYIHYGANEFNPDLFIEPGYDEEWSFKPINGLWASEDTDDPNVLTWKKWCLSENFNVGSLEKWFRFKLSDDAKGFVIKDSSIIDTPYVKYYNMDLPIHEYSRMIIDFDKLKEDGFTHINFDVNSWTQWAFPLWDVDCILIIDPKVIIPVK